MTLQGSSCCSHNAALGLDAAAHPGVGLWVDMHFRVASLTLK